MRFRRKEVSLPIFKTKFEEHLDNKDRLVELIQAADGERIDEHNQDVDDNVTKTDFCYAGDLERPWVRKLMIDFQKVFVQFAEECGHKAIVLDKIWFQLYAKNSYHNWHTHSGHYSGVYYLKYPKGSAKTQFMDFAGIDVFEIPAKEGDIIFFPCQIAHQSSIQKLDEEKIIISWNLELGKLNDTMLHYLK